MTTTEPGTEPGTGPTMKVYVAVWLGMIAIVAVESALTYAHVSSGTLVASVLVLAFIEAGVALRYFMHLKYEVPLLFWTLIPGLLFAFVMMNQFWADAARVSTLRFPIP
ncbi:MAG: cytochrome C oxidase subunit IV family protein [Gemmatimonadaceae bacterium]|nr:cytochrome C oxidase subunit IV family protein [Gemmatimonadaceae bacterium]